MEGLTLVGGQEDDAMCECNGGLVGRKFCQHCEAGLCRAVALVDSEIATVEQLLEEKPSPRARTVLCELEQVYDQFLEQWREFHDAPRSFARAGP